MRVVTVLRRSHARSSRSHNERTGMTSKDEKPKKPKKPTVVNVFDTPVRITGSTGTDESGRTFQVGIDNRRRKNNED